jgi:glycolate oxidase FAD binding subunit
MIAGAMDEPSVITESLSFDGTTPIPVIAPASAADLGDLVRRATGAGTALYPVGGGTMLDLGLAPLKPGVAVDLRGLDRVIDYPARDMTITVQAGITIGKLQAILRAERQQLSVDVPLPERATLGGAIAANASGPRRYGLGTLRDYVIGISVVNDEGNEIKAGGRVVKNVAGYDLMKLYTGSLGTLGIITQATLKLKPLPESSRLLVLSATLSDIARVLDQFQTSKTRPVCLDLLDPSAGRVLGLGGDRWSLVVGFEDNFKAVTWQVQQFRQELPAELRPALREVPDDGTEALWSALRDFALWPEAEVSFKANLLPSATPEFCRRAATASPAPLLQARAGNGIVLGHLRGLTAEQARTLLEPLLAFAAEAKGNLIVTRCPPAWKSALPVWGRPTGDRALMRAVKAKLDPGNVFNPGRFVDNI